MKMHKNLRFGGDLGWRHSADDARASGEREGRGLLRIIGSSSAGGSQRVSQ
jgi:hypothetical protein